MRFSEWSRPFPTLVFGKITNWCVSARFGTFRQNYKFGTNWHVSGKNVGNGLDRSAFRCVSVQFGTFRQNYKFGTNWHVLEKSV
ncbi:MAG: hypothetical protein RR273_01140, partial [Oscillospiraceae bacterium]